MQSKKGKRRVRSAAIAGAFVVSLCGSMAWAVDPPTLRDRAEAGDPKAQYQLGNNYLNGEGAPKDFAPALLWMTYAANSNHGPAQLSLGVSYFHGWGVATDSLSAKYWLVRASQNGMREAQYYLDQPSLSLVDEGALQPNPQAPAGTLPGHVLVSIYGKVTPVR